MELVSRCREITRIRERGTGIINETTNERCNDIYIIRRIGTTTYRVRVFLEKEGKGTLGDKIIRLIQNDVLENNPGCDTMGLPQTSRQSERSA